MDSSRWSSSRENTLLFSAEKRFHRDTLGTILRAHGVSRRAILGMPHRHPGVLTLLVHEIKVDTEVRLAPFIQEPFLNGERLDPLDRFHTCILRVAASAHFFDTNERCQRQQV